MNQSGYFPWSEGDTSNSNSNSTGTSSSTLDPGSALSQGRNRGIHSRGPTPPPPRRVQSEGNPRGLATRGGKSAVNDDAFIGKEHLSDVEGLLARRGVQIEEKVPVGSGAMGQTGGMSLGPKGSERIGETEIMESTMKEPKRKAD
jgi:hypothetical protein